jgi:extracellular matrix regulatory protein A
MVFCAFSNLEPGPGKPQNGSRQKRRQKGPSMDVKLLNIGFGNTVLANRVVAIVSPASAPMKRLKEDAKLSNKLIDATMGRRTRSIIITDSDHVILSGVQAETIAQRLLAESAIKEAASRAEKD